MTPNRPEQRTVALQDERAAWVVEIDAVLGAYGDDPEEGHVLEDALLWSFIRRVCFEELADASGVAELLIDRLSRAERVKWFS